MKELYEYRFDLSLDGSDRICSVSIIVSDHVVVGLFLFTFKYHVFAPMGRFQLESIYLYFQNKGKLTLPLCLKHSIFNIIKSFYNEYYLLTIYPK